MVLFIDFFGESWLLLLSCLAPTSACAVRVAARTTKRHIDTVSQLLLMSRLLLTSIPDGFPPPLALATSWRARHDASDEDVATLALLSAERGFLAYLRGLSLRLGTGRMLELSNEYGVTLLHAAASAGHAQVCAMLCQWAAEAHDPPGWQGVLHALSKTTVRKRSVLHSAAAGGDVHVLNTIFAVVPAQEIQNLLSSTDCRRRCCALLAVHLGWMTAAHQLVEAHRSFSTTIVSEAESDAGTALLVHASESDDHALAFAVLRKGADPNRARAADKITPLAAAATHGSISVLKLLLEHGKVVVDLAEGTGGRSALHLACQSGNAEVVEQLLAFGANPRLEAPGGRTALYFAAERGSTVCIDALLKYGGLRPVDALHMTVRSLTPLSVAQRRGNIAVADYLSALTAGTRPTLPRTTLAHVSPSSSPRARASSSGNLACFNMSPRTPPRTPRAQNASLTSAQTSKNRALSRPCVGTSMVRSLILVAERTSRNQRSQPSVPPNPVSARGRTTSPRQSSPCRNSTSRTCSASRMARSLTPVPVRERTAQHFQQTQPPPSARSRTTSPRPSSPNRAPNLANLHLATPRQRCSTLREQCTGSAQPQYIALHQMSARNLVNPVRVAPEVEVVTPPQHSANCTPRRIRRATSERPPTLPEILGAFGGA